MTVDPIDIALLVARAIEQVGGEYFVGGSLASSFQGEPRATNDIDMVVKIPLGKTSEFIASLGADFEVDLDTLRDALIQRRSCNIFFLPLVTKIDLFAVGTTPYDEIEFARRKAVRVRDSNETLVLKTPEDTVLRKLLWYREGGEVSEKQWRDLTQVLRISRDVIDLEYITSWADRLGLTTLLARARSEVAR